MRTTPASSYLALGLATFGTVQALVPRQYGAVDPIPSSTSLIFIGNAEGGTSVVVGPTPAAPAAPAASPQVPDSLLPVQNTAPAQLADTLAPPTTLVTVTTPPAAPLIPVSQPNLNVSFSLTTTASGPRITKLSLFQGIGCRFAIENACGQVPGVACAANVCKTQESCTELNLDCDKFAAGLPQPPPARRR